MHCLTNPSKQVQIDRYCFVLQSQPIQVHGTIVVCPPSVQGKCVLVFDTWFVVVFRLKMWLMGLWNHLLIKSQYFSLGHMKREYSTITIHLEAKVYCTCWNVKKLDHLNRFFYLAQRERIKSHKWQKSINCGTFPLLSCMVEPTLPISDLGPKSLFFTLMPSLWDGGNGVWWNKNWLLLCHAAACKAHLSIVFFSEGSQLSINSCEIQYAVCFSEMCWYVWSSIKHHLFDKMAPALY